MSPSHIQSIKLACEKTRGATFGVFFFYGGCSLKSDTWHFIVRAYICA